MDILKLKRIVEGDETWERPTTFEVEIGINMGSTVDITFSFDNASPSDPFGPDSTFRSRISMVPIAVLQLALDFARESQKATCEIFKRDVPEDVKWDITYKSVLKKG